MEERLDIKYYNIKNQPKIPLLPVAAWASKVQGNVFCFSFSMMRFVALLFLQQDSV